MTQAHVDDLMEQNKRLYDENQWLHYQVRRFKELLVLEIERCATLMQQVHDAKKQS